MLEKDCRDEYEKGEKKKQKVQSQKREKRRKRKKRDKEKEEQWKKKGEVKKKEREEKNRKKNIKTKTNWEEKRKKWKEKNNDETRLWFSRRWSFKQCLAAWLWFLCTQKWAKKISVSIRRQKMTMGEVNRGMGAKKRR